MYLILRTRVVPVTVTVSEITKFPKSLPRSFYGIGPQFLYIFTCHIAQKPYIQGLVLTYVFQILVALFYGGIVCFDMK